MLQVILDLVQPPMQVEYLRLQRDDEYTDIMVFDAGVGELKLLCDKTGLVGGGEVGHADFAVDAITAEKGLLAFQ